MDKVKKNSGIYLACLGVAVLIVLVFSSSTSPFYSFAYADYYGNASSTSLLMGKAWLHGKIPYKDLFASGGPLYYVVQSIGWFVGEKTGVCIIQMLNLSWSLFLLYKIFRVFISKKSSCVMMLLSVFAIVATMTGGNSEEEFCLTLSITALYLCISGMKKQEFTRKAYLAIGLLTGAVVMVKITAGGAIYGIAIYMLYVSLTRRKKAAIQDVGMFVGGIAVCVLPFIVYFLLNDALNQMIQATIIHNMKALFVDITDVRLLLHKGVKCVPVGLLILGGIICTLRYKRREGKWLIAIGVGLLCFAITGGGNWYLYLPTIFCIPMLIAVFGNVLEGKRYKYLAGFCILCMAGIYLLPVKHFITYIVSEDLSAYQELTKDLINYQEQTGEKELLLVDVPAYVYLETDIIPTYQYFAQQTEYNETDESIKDDLNDYLLESCTTHIIVVKSKGSFYMEIGDYIMCDVYYHDKEIITVYEYLPQE